MKTRISLLLFFIISSSFLFAQEKKTEWNVRAGLNLSNASTEELPGYNKKVKAGFKLGVFVDQLLKNDFYLQSGLEFTTKGVRFSPEHKGETNQLNQMYLQIPVAIAYKVPFAVNKKIVINLGPYVAYGISGKADTGAKKKQDVFSKTGLKRFDLGLGGGIGLELHRVLFTINYEQGLLDIDQRKKELYKNQNFFFVLGYKF